MNETRIPPLFIPFLCSLGLLSPAPASGQAASPKPSAENFGYYSGPYIGIPTGVPTPQPFPTGGSESEGMAAGQQPSFGLSPNYGAIINGLPQQAPQFQLPQPTTTAICECNCPPCPTQPAPTVTFYSGQSPAPTSTSSPSEEPEARPEPSPAYGEQAGTQGGPATSEVYGPPVPPGWNPGT